MAIAGIAVTKNTEPLGAGLIGTMLAALNMGERSQAASKSDAGAQIGAVSGTGTASAWSSGDVMVACDCDLADVQEETGAGELRAGIAAAQVIGGLYLRHGAGLLKKLRGAFALAVWDARSKTMLIAIDRFAMKPLVYASDAAQLVFASHPRGIFAGGRIGKEVNPQALANFLNFSMVPAPECAFRSLAKLPAGCFLSWEDGRMKMERYWDLEYSESDRSSEGQLAEELLSAMSEAVRLHSEDVASGRLGCFLSGGTDSSSILGLLSRAKPAALHAFSIGFSEERFNELEYARLAAETFQARHSIAVLGPEETFANIPRIVAAYDEPFGNASVLPTYACLRLAREEGVEVMLAGDGGDELFGGNERYCAEKKYALYDAAPRSLRRYLIEPIALRIPAGGPAGKVRRYVERASKGNPDRYFQWLLLQAFAPEKILGPNISCANGHGDLLAIPREHYRTAPAHSELNRLLYIDIKMTLGDNDLPKVVRAAELAGVNVRFPFLDHPLAEFSGRLPAGFKVRGLEKRYLFKKATAGLLPQAILQKKKHGFGLPIGLWLKQHPLWRGLAQDVLFDPRTYQRGYFQRGFVENLFTLMDADHSTYYGDLLWLFLMAELWHRHHAEGVAA